MRVAPKQIPPEGKSFSGEEPSRILELGPGGEVVFEGPIRYKVRVVVVSGEVVVLGKMAARATFRCSRCAEPFPQDVTDVPLECSIPVPDLDQSVDLTPEMRESMLLALPAHPVCSSGCKGLCPQCGTNLNKERCNCSPRIAAGWEALNNLKLKTRK